MKSCLSAGWRPVLAPFLLACTLIISAGVLSPLSAQTQIPAFLPTVGEVSPGQPMPLDGTWLINTINKKIRIEAGRAYAVDGWLHLFVLKIEPGMVVIRDITPTAPGEYSGEDLPLMGKWNAKVVADRSLSVTVAGAMGPISYKLVPIQLDNREWYSKEMVVAGLITEPPPQTSPPAMFLQPGEPEPPAYQPSPPPVSEPEPPAYQPAPQPIAEPAPPVYTPPPAYNPGAPAHKPSPPVRKPKPVKSGCGGKGAKPCGKKGKVDAVKVGTAQPLGCKGKNLYFTPHQGGQCWRCPEGFKRTTTPIHKPNSCKARGFKIGKKDRTDAKYIRPALGCAKAQFQKGKTCYACPAHSKKIAILGVFNPVASCKMKPYCDAGLKPGPVPPKSLMDLGPSFTQRCAPPLNPKKTILPMAKHHIGLAGGINGAAAKFAIEIAKDKALRQAIKSKNKQAISTAIKRMASFNKLKSMARSKGYRSISIGVGSGVKAGLGLEQEMGVALDWDAGIRFYGTKVVSKGVALSAGGGISLGVWTVDKDQLGGYAHGVSTSIPAGVVDVGGGAWFSYYPIQFLGLAYTAGLGVGVEVGVYNEALTELYN